MNVLEFVVIGVSLLSFTISSNPIDLNKSDTLEFTISRSPLINYLTSS